MKSLQQRLLALQILAVFAAFGGEFAGIALLTTAGVTIFFVALGALFVQMTAALLTGLRRSDGRATLR